MSVAFEDALAASVATTLRSARALGVALESVDLPATPSIARAVQAEENRWRSIEAEFGLLSSLEVGELLGSRSSNPRSAASDRHRAGKLLGVRRGRETRYPGFQFSHGTVLPVIADLVALARRHQWSEQELALWLIAPTGWLDDRRPVDVLAADSDAVLAAADAKFTTQW
ncbi:hypothetical protein [Speluncibacter jeojiensis]|uniref:Antitoxin Xre/MbcA/ParS-like toxin-binding domain-containing protein n=1 Tax=Speluncibacter jeojiensis TaxID=2710754 RepID=A0A9X4RGD6_9ACTN|nr:hypothetical protein [Corynebacteriales bacterium D3-21]